MVKKVSTIKIEDNTEKKEPSKTVSTDKKPVKTKKTAQKKAVKKSAPKKTAKKKASQTGRGMKQKDVEKKLASLDGWSVSTKHDAISKSFAFPTFVAGLAFIAKVTVHAEVMQHHPDIELSYGTVKVKLSTHDADGLTKKDFELAERIDTLKLM